MSGRFHPVGRVRALRFPPAEVDDVVIAIHAARDIPQVSAAAVIAAAPARAGRTWAALPLP